ncbi:hypothetical protein ACHAXT_002189 [Thalassiosira profunda]
MVMLVKLLERAVLATTIGGGVAFSTGAPRLCIRCGAHRPSPKDTLPSSARVLMHQSAPNDGSHHGEHPSNVAESSSTVASQAALIAGTTIGGGFLALPAATAPCGAAPAALGLVGVWLFLLGGALSLSNSIFMLKRSYGKDEIETRDANSEVSIFSLIKECFGSTAGILGGLVFLLLVKVTLVAQLSKIGVLLEGTMPALDRRVWTSLFSVAIAALCLVAKQRRIERINDALTATMLTSFSILVALTGGCGWHVDGLKRADFKSLTPTTSPWAIPIFIQLLLYNEVVPLVSGRLNDERKVRQAIIWGSSVPLIMCLVWSCVALGLVPYEPSQMASGVIYDPLNKLGEVVSAKGSAFVGKAFLASVSALAGSAICTTATGSILASTQYLDDLIANLRDKRTDGNTHRVKQSMAPTKYRRLITHTLAVAPSAFLAASGSRDWYYRATSLAGEFPCTFLYGLIPPLCNIRLRFRQRTTGDITLGLASALLRLALRECT